MLNRVRLSSKMTFIYKVIFPCVWIPVFGMGALSSWLLSEAHQPPADIQFILVVVWLVGSAFILIFALHLRTVWLQGDHLIVSGFLREFSVPLAFIDGVSEGHFLKPKVIKFRVQPSPNLPRLVVCMAPADFRFFRLFKSSEHPVVKMLRSLVEAAKKEAATA